MNEILEQAHDAKVTLGGCWVTLHIPWPTYITSNCDSEKNPVSWLCKTGVTGAEAGSPSFLMWGLLETRLP